jgi:hypothetical protein
LVTWVEFALLLASTDAFGAVTFGHACHLGSLLTTAGKLTERLYMAHRLPECPLSAVKDQTTTDGRYANYEAFIGVPWEGSGCSGQASIKRRISDRLISPSP